MWAILLSVFIVYWLLLSLFAFYMNRKTFQYLKTQPQIQIKQNWKGFISKDRKIIDQKAILIGCFTRFPLIFTLYGFFLVTFMPLILISKIFGKKAKQLVFKTVSAIGNFCIRINFDIRQQIDYRNYKIQTPIVICNHINWFDIWYLGITFTPLSIVAKAAIKKMPFVGAIGDFFDTIYVERSNANQNQRNVVVQRIKERVQKFALNSNKQCIADKTYPVIIFPQGTTSNGNNILTFKLGAFNDLAPITLFALKYKCKQFNMGMGDISQTKHLLVSYCLRPTLQVVHKVLHALPNQTPEKYCQRARQTMSQLTGFQKVQCGYRDQQEYQQAMNDALKTKN